MQSRTGKVALLLFGTGACALVYQVAWLREMRLVFGASTAASAAVLAIFMGGLGVGSALLGRRADRHPTPLLFYAHLELLIALSAAVTPLLVWLVRQLYIGIGGSVTLGLGGATVVRLILATVVLCVPTVAMGGTLPAASRAVETASDVSRRRLAALYGANTLGAVTGAFLATFVLLEVFGTRRTLWLASLINVLIALTARSLARRFAAESGEGVGVAPVAAEEKVIRGADSPAAAPASFVLPAAAIVGFAFFLMELVWYRMLGPLLGGSSFTFGLVLAVALFGIGLGGLAYASLGTQRPATLRVFALTCVLEAFCMAVPYALGDRIALIAALLRPLGLFGFSGLVVSWSVVAALVILPAAIVAGIQFPLLIALLGQGRRQVGRHVGYAYAWNTAGAILGSLAGGFGLLPLLSATGTWRLVVVLLLALGAVAMLLSWRPQARSVGLLAPVATGTCALLLLTTGGPSAVWRHSPIGAGRVELRHLAPNSVRDWSNARRRVVLWEADGVESSVALIADEGYAFVVNGKTDGSARLDAPTQVMGGLVGALLHPDPRRALVVGLGTGSTAGWLAAVPSIERVDIVELEPVIVEVARAMTPVNQDVLDNPKTAIIIADAREVLLTTPQRYDLVFSEPSNPYRAGIASLFTREFYQAVAERLAVDGIFLQWVQAYEVDAQTIRTIYATLAAVFPHVETWYTQDRDLLLVASMDPVVYDVPSLRRRVEEEPYRTALAAVWRTTGLEGFLARFGARASLAREVARREENYLNTDDWTLVEFAFARSVGKPALFNTAELRAVARMRNEDRPEVSGGEIDWELVEDRRLTQFTVDGMVAPPDPAGPAERQQRAEAQAHYLHGRMAEALAAWRAQPREPEGPLEILVVAEALARGGDDAALPYIAELRRFQPVEADGLTATLRWKQGKPDAAAESLIAAFTRYRDDPWPLPGVMSRVLDVAAQVGAERGDLAQQLHDALSLPFAARLLEQKRLLTLVRLTRSLDESCQSAWATLEPHVPWERDLLWQRFVCYRDADDPLLAAAEEDLKQFLAAVPMPFATGIEAPPAYASP